MALSQSWKIKVQYTMLHYSVNWIFILVKGHFHGVKKYGGFCHLRHNLLFICKSRRFHLKTAMNWFASHINAWIFIKILVIHVFSIFLHNTIFLNNKMCPPQCRYNWDTFKQINWNNFLHSSEFWEFVQNYVKDI